MRFQNAFATIPGASIVTDATFGAIERSGKTLANQESRFKPSERTLKDISLLAEAPPAKVKELEECCEWLEYGADEIVVNLKDESTNVYFVVKGKLRAMDYLTDETTRSRWRNWGKAAPSANCRRSTSRSARPG